jgi:methionyl-tRNA synthetase
MAPINTRLTWHSRIERYRSMTQEQPPQSQPQAQPQAQAPAPPPVPPQQAGKPTIAYEDFAKLDLRVATVLEVTDHPNADKLLVVKVDLGGEQRQIIAGLKGLVTAESLVGKQVVIVANLLPRKMRGLESNGMLLAATAAGSEPKRVVVLTTAEAVPPGSTVS